MERDTLKQNNLVSVIIPVYNAEQNLLRCLQSIAAQTYGNIELVIVNDCSTDTSIQIMNDFFGNHQNSKHILLKILSHKQNKGVASARNTGLDNATGEYIYFVDSDDWIEPETLQYMIREAVDKDYDILGHELWFHYNKKRLITLPDIHNGDDAFIKMTNGQLRWNLWLYLVKKSLYEQNQIRFLEGMNMGEDMMVLGKLFLCAKNVGVIHKPFYNYVSANPTSLTKEKSETRMQQMTANINELENFVRKTKGEDFLKYMQQFILQAKIPLLFSGKTDDYRKWLNWFPEVNKHSLSNKNSPIRNRILEYAALNKMFFILKIHHYFTNIFLKLIYK